MSISRNPVLKNSISRNECKKCTLQVTENEIQRGMNTQKNIKADMAKTKSHLKQNETKAHR